MDTPLTDGSVESARVLPQVTEVVTSPSAWLPMRKWIRAWRHRRSPTKQIRGKSNGYTTSHQLGLHTQQQRMESTAAGLRKPAKNAGAKRLLFIAHSALLTRFAPFFSHSRFIPQFGCDMSGQCRSNSHLLPALSHEMLLPSKRGAFGEAEYASSIICNRLTSNLKQQSALTSNWS